MPPSIHPVDLIAALRHKHLTPAIVFLTSRRACDEAIEAFQRSQAILPPVRQQTISTVLDQVIAQYPSIADHPLLPTVTQVRRGRPSCGTPAVLEDRGRRIDAAWMLGCCVCNDHAGGGVDFPARTVVDYSVQCAKDSGHRRSDHRRNPATRRSRGTARKRPRRFRHRSRLRPISISRCSTKGLTGRPEAIDSQFLISYPMVLNLLKAHPLDHIQAILAKSFAQFQLNRRAETLESKLDVLREQMQPYGPRVCTDWITQWQAYDHARKQKAHRIQVTRRETPELAAKLHFLSPGRVVGFPKGRGLVLRVYRSRGQRHPMVTVLRPGGSISESPANMIAHIYDRVWM